MVPCVRQDSQLPSRRPNSFLHLLLTSSSHPCLYYTPQICGFAHRQPFTHFCPQVHFYNANTFAPSKRFLLECDKNCQGWPGFFFQVIQTLCPLCPWAGYINLTQLTVPNRLQPTQVHWRRRAWFKTYLHNDSFSISETFLIPTTQVSPPSFPLNSSPCITTWKVVATNLIQPFSKLPSTQ